MREGRPKLKSSRGVARLAIAGIVAAAVVVVNSSAASASGWGIVSSPNQGGSNNQLTGVSCTSSTRCVAVGFFYNGSAHQTLVESWNGSSWSIISTPNVGTSSNLLSAVSCTSSTSCVAVGYYFINGSSHAQTLVESWNGSSWSITASPNLGSSDNVLSGVACASSTSCVAVGYYLNGSSVPQTLVESWNGSSWSITATPNHGTGENLFNGVSCPSSTSCVAVGLYANGSGVGQTLVESWNGISWSLASSPNQGTSYNVLLGVSCTSSTGCVAVGDYLNGSGTDQTMVESWNGTSWSITASPDRGSADNVLRAVACTGSTSCVAVGDHFNGSGTDQTLVETWTGTSWSLTASPNQGNGNSGLSGVACTSSTSCTAVGGGQNQVSTMYQTLVEAWNGTSWSITASPNMNGSNNSLNAVSCTSTTKCMAVGDTFNGGVQQTLAERWNGRSWSIIASPNQGSSNNGLSGVSCTSSTSCVAVGTYANAGVDQTLVETWNGSTWSITPSPNQGTDSNFLSSVACTSSTSCVAVGRYFDDTAAANLTLIESWNGSTWSITSSANRSSSSNSLTGVSCISSTSCTAVGVSVNGASIAQTLIESWNGSVWSIIPSPNPGGISNELNGVVCTSSTSCVAVGDYFNASNVDRTLVESWNGSTWVVVTTPNKSKGGNNLLSAVSCTTSTTCVAVGFHFNGSSVEQTLVETWNGSTWSITPSPNQGSSNSGLSGVACTGSTTCTAVGAYTSSGVSQTLVETGSA